jgi:hypothetical protein
MPTLPLPRIETRTVLLVAAQALAAAVGGYQGYDFGLRVSGPVLGVVAGINTAFWAAIFVGPALDWVFKRTPRRGRKP